VDSIDAYEMVFREMWSDGCSSVLEVGQMDIVIPTPIVGWYFFGKLIDSTVHSKWERKVLFHKLVWVRDDNQ